MVIGRLAGRRWIALSFHDLTRRVRVNKEFSKLQSPSAAVIQQMFEAHTLNSSYFYWKYFTIAKGSWKPKYHPVSQPQKWSTPGQGWAALEDAVAGEVCTAVLGGWNSLLNTGIFRIWLAPRSYDFPFYWPVPPCRNRGYHSSVPSFWKITLIVCRNKHTVYVC